MIKAIFLDKDGTLIPDIPYNVNPDLITLQGGVITGLKQLAYHGFTFFVISNQAGVAKGFFAEADLLPVAQKLRDLFAADGLQIADFYWAYNHPHGKVAQYAITCNLRKPQPGMLFLAAQKHQIDLKNSWMIGDAFTDVEAGKRAGCQTILIGSNQKIENQLNYLSTPTYTAANILEAAKLIIAQNQAD